MRGSVRRRGDPGTWEYRLDKGAQPVQTCQACGKRFWVDVRPLETCQACGGQLHTGTARRESTVSGFRTQKDAQAALDKAKVALEGGDYVESSKLTVRQYLIDEWLPSIEATIRPATLLVYRVHVEHYIVPRIGHCRLQRLSPGAIGAMYAQLMSGDGSRALSTATVRLTAVVLHRALRDAVRRRHLARNPSDDVDAPRPEQSGTERREMKTWTAAQLHAFLESTKNDRLYALWHLLAMTGLRRGEALGLKWEDVDMETGRLAVRRSLTSVNYMITVSEPKTKKGRRTVPLDAATMAVMRAQAVRQLDEQKRWGEAWVDAGYCFTREDGRPLQPDIVTKNFRTAERAIPLPQIRLHDLRHTWATLALQAGVHPKVVQERLGHSTISMTLDIYSHAIPAMQEQASELVAALVAGNPVAVQP